MPAPAPAPKLSAKVKTVLTDVRMVLGYVAAVGEVVLAQLPSGSAHDVVAAVIPIASALSAVLISFGASS